MYSDIKKYLISFLESENKYKKVADKKKTIDDIGASKYHNHFLIHADGGSGELSRPHRINTTIIIEICKTQAKIKADDSEAELIDEAAMLTMNLLRQITLEGKHVANWDEVEFSVEEARSEDYDYMVIKLEIPVSYKI